MTGTGRVSIHVACSSEESYGLDGTKKSALLYLSFRFAGEESMHTLTVPVTPWGRKGEGEPGDDAQDIADKIAKEVEKKVKETDNKKNPNPIPKSKAEQIHVRTTSVTSSKKGGSQARPGTPVTCIDTWADIEIPGIDEIDTACCDASGKITSELYGEDVGLNADSAVKVVKVELQGKAMPNTAKCPNEPKDAYGGVAAPGERPLLNDPLAGWQDVPMHFATTLQGARPGAGGQARDTRTSCAALELQFGSPASSIGHGRLVRLVFWPVVRTTPEEQLRIIEAALLLEGVRVLLWDNQLVLIGDVVGRPIRSVRLRYSLAQSDFPWHVIFHLWTPLDSVGDARPLTSREPVARAVPRILQPDPPMSAFEEGAPHGDVSNRSTSEAQPTNLPPAAPDLLANGGVVMPVLPPGNGDSGATHPDTAG